MFHKIVHLYQMIHLGQKFLTIQQILLNQTILMFLLPQTILMFLQNQMYL